MKCAKCGEENPPVLFDGLCGSCKAEKSKE